VILLALAATASAAPLSGQTQAWVDGGYLLDQPAIAFGAGHLWAPGILRFGVQASAGARATLIEGHPQDPAFGLATVTVGASGRRAGFVALLDTAILSAAEEDCDPFGQDCRHPWWVGTEGLGLSVSAAAGLRIEGVGASGGQWSLVLALQPYQRYRSTWWVIPRADLTAAVGRFTTVHVWGNRYGVAFGVGRRLGTKDQRAAMDPKNDSVQSGAPPTPDHTSAPITSPPTTEVWTTPTAPFAVY
jgi:hypothetical protein